MKGTVNHVIILYVTLSCTIDQKIDSHGVTGRRFEVHVSWCKVRVKPWQLLAASWKCFGSRKWGAAKNQFHSNKATCVCEGIRPGNHPVPQLSNVYEVLLVKYALSHCDQQWLPRDSRTQLNFHTGTQVIFDACSIYVNSNCEPHILYVCKTSNNFETSHYAWGRDYQKIGCDKKFQRGIPIGFRLFHRAGNFGEFFPHGVRLIKPIRFFCSWHWIELKATLLVQIERRRLIGAAQWADGSLSKRPTHCPSDGYANRPLEQYIMLDCMNKHILMIPHIANFSAQRLDVAELPLALFVVQ